MPKIIVQPHCVQIINLMHFCLNWKRYLKCNFKIFMILLFILFNQLCYLFNLHKLPHIFKIWFMDAVKLLYIYILGVVYKKNKSIKCIQSIALCIKKTCSSYVYAKIIIFWHTAYIIRLLICTLVYLVHSYTKTWLGNKIYSI